MNRKKYLFPLNMYMSDIAPEAKAVMFEHAKSIEKHGNPTFDNLHSGTAILFEEVLEYQESLLKCIRAINDLKDGNQQSVKEVREEALHLYNELAQCGAVNLKLMRRIRIAMETYFPVED